MCPIAWIELNGLSIIENCKLNGIDPQTWMTQTLTKLANDYPAKRIGELMPWTDVA